MDGEVTSAHVWEERNRRHALRSETRRSSVGCRAVEAAIDTPASPTGTKSTPELEARVYRPRLYHPAIYAITIIMSK